MYIIRDIWDSLFETFNAKDNDRIEQVQREVRKAYYELCGATSWEVLRAETAYAYDSTEDGMWLPADLIGIDCVTDGTDVWKKTNMGSAPDINSLSKLWYISKHNRTALVAGKGLKISDGATEFTGVDSITSEHIGEFIRIGGQSAVYKLASATTLETPYYGPKQTGATFEVRPVGTKKIKLLSEGAETDETAATIYYWRLPAQLYNADQLMLLPTARILELAVAVRMFGIDKDMEGKNSASSDLYGSKGRYEGELSRAISMNPDFIPPVQPENKNGTSASWGAQAR